MAKLRKMLGDIQSKECHDLMHLIETQSKQTVASWAIRYAKEHYFPIYQEQDSKQACMMELVSDCEDVLAGNQEQQAIKLKLKEATQIARDSKDPIIQAAARSIVSACGSIHTPTNALGFLFYGAACIAYHTAGLLEDSNVYDQIALAELRRAYESLTQVAIQGEEHPVKVNWNC